MRDVAATGGGVLIKGGSIESHGCDLVADGLPGIVACGLRLVLDGSDFGSALFAGGREPFGDVASSQAEDADTNW